MEKRVTKLLKGLELKAIQKQKDIAAFEDAPLTLFTELQKDAELIPNLLVVLGEESLLEYQAWQYPLVTQALKKTFDLSEYSLGWNEAFFQSPIWLYRQGYPVAQIEPYERTFRILPSEMSQEALEKYQRVQKKMLETYTDIRKLEIKKSNPFIEEDDSFLNTLKVTATKKKLIKKLDQEMAPLVTQYRTLEAEAERLFAQLENFNKERIQDDYELEKVGSSICMKLNLKMINDNDTLLYDAQKQISIWEEESALIIEKMEKDAVETEQV